MAIEDLSGLPITSFHSAPPDARWQQVNVALVRFNGDAVPSARALFLELAPTLEEWRLDGRLHGWFFMRKPPDVRLRFCLRANDGNAASILDTVLQSLHSSGRIGRYFRSQYQPEQSRFGGPAAMEFVHAYFHVDSILWLHLDQLDSQSQRKLDPDLLLPANLHHLFQCCCGTDRVIEAWRGLARLIMQGAIDITPQQPRLPATLDALASQRDLVSSEGLALRTYAQSNEMFSQGLLGLGSKTVVEQPIEQIVATVALFNLNRHGVPGALSGPMTARVLAALGDDVSETFKNPE